AAAAHDAAVVVVSRPETLLPGVTVSLQELAGQAGAVIQLDRPVPDEFVAVVIGPGYGQALCARAAGGVELVTLADLPTAATISRVLLGRTG
ncbi:hypothetical protein AB0F81_48365, partial [Actinoplanes sp. NPDC024001]|uniref:hypothetical protein n=1 Tax=Actinoplanes sp. NPDC024001 TaxID=3154598 RepID=UPI00340657EC